MNHLFSKAVFSSVLVLSLLTGCTAEDDEIITRPDKPESSAEPAEHKETPAPEEKEEEVHEDLVQTIAFADKEMDYIHFGNENGKTLVILPGASLKSVMGSAEAIVSAYALPAETYDIYLFDRIRKMPENYRVGDMADDMLTVLKALKIDEFSIMGVSIGGMIAQSMAIKSPDKVSALVLCSTACRTEESAAELYKEWKQFAEERNTQALMESFGSHVYSPSFYEQYKDQILASGEGASDQDFDNVVTCMNALIDFDIYDYLPRIRCPVFVIGAGNDQVIGTESSPLLISRIGCGGYIYEGYGHAVYDEAPDYLSRVKEFLDKTLQ